MDQETKQHFDELKRYLDGKFAEIETKFATKQDLERVETALLTEFHKWAPPVDTRQRSHSAMLRAIDQDLEVLKERVEKLEKRPPS